MGKERLSGGQGDVLFVCMEGMGKNQKDFLSENISYF